MGMRFPVGPMRGRAQPNPWLYVGPEERRAAEDYLVEQGGPNLWGMLDPRDPLHPVNRAGDGTPLQEKMYEQNLRDVDDWTYANIVTPMTARGFDTLGPALGAGVAGAYETFIPGPEGWGFGMAGGGKKVSNLWDLMTPEAREMAKRRHEQLREDMLRTEGEEPLDPTKYLDPYASGEPTGQGRRVNPYEAMEQQERRTLDPDTGLPIERRDEYGREMTQRDVDSNKAAAEAAAERAEARKNMSWRERMDEDIEAWWDDQWDNIDDGSMWDSWSYGGYSDEVPTRGDELEMLQDALRYNDSFRDEIKEKLREGIDLDDPPDEFFEWWGEGSGKSIEDRRKNWTEVVANDNVREESLDRWLDDQADEYIDKRIKEWEPDADSWNEELEWRDPVEWDENYDFYQAPFGDEKIYGERTRTRRYLQNEFSKPRDRLKRLFGDDENAEKLADELSENIYKSSVDDYFNENQREVWETQWDLSDEVIIDRLPDKLDDWDDETLEKVFEDEFEAVVENMREDIDGEIDHYIKRSKQPVPDETRKSIKKFIFDNVKNDIKESWEKGMQENVRGREDEIIERLKDQVDDD